MDINTSKANLTSMEFDIDVVRMSSKGQIVIPREMRSGIKQGDKMIVVRRGNEITLKKATKKLLDDMEFERRTRESIERYEKNPESFKTMEAEEFLKKLRAWSKGSDFE